MNGTCTKTWQNPSYFVKLLVREKDDLFSEISWLESSLNFLKTSPGCRFFLFHTNVVKHEKEGQ